MRKNIKNGILKVAFCILIVLLSMFQVDAARLEKIEYSMENKEFLPMLPPFLMQEEKWMETFGRLFIDETGYSVDQTVDGGYILVGTAYYKAGGIWLIKVDANGKEEWENMFGGEGMSGDCVIQTIDGGYTILGEGFGDLWLIKVDAEGNEEWKRSFGGNDDEWLWGDHLLQQTHDGGYIVTGATQSYGRGHNDVWLLKIDEEGIEQWNTTFGGVDSNVGGSVQQTTDGGYIIGGCTDEYGSSMNDVLLIKTDPFGNEEWNMTFGNKDVNERCFSVQQTIEGGYIVAGNTYLDGLIIKTDSFGNTEWIKTFDTDDCRIVYSIQQTNDNGYILTGITGIQTWDSDLVLLKLSSDGTLEWNKIFGKHRFCEMGYCVRQSKDEGYIITGFKQCFCIYAGDIPLFLDVWLIKTDAMGNSKMLLSNPFLRNFYDILEELSSLSILKKGKIPILML